MKRLLAVLLLILTAGLFIGPPEQFFDGREGPGDVIDNDHDDYPHDCLAGDLCTPFPMP